MPRYSFVLAVAAYLVVVDIGLPEVLAEDANVVVMQTALAVKDGGGYNKAFSGSGTPNEIRFKGELILAKATGGTYGSGFTLMVVMEAADAVGLLSDKTVEEVKTFHRQWYGRTEESRERQCAVAVEDLGIGKEVSLDEAKPGDFVQFWRQKRGHSVLFLEWITEDGQRVGLKYRSSQRETDGVGDYTEYFSDAKGKDGTVDRKRIYFCRLSEKPDL